MDASEDQRPFKKPKTVDTHTYAGKRQKHGGKWKTAKARSTGEISISASGIHSGDKGIFVTCDMGQESKCLREMTDLLSQYAGNADGISTSGQVAAAEDDTDLLDAEDVESSIQKELESMKPSDSSSPFGLVKLDIQCVSFVRISNNTDPVSVVHSICKDAQSRPDQKRSRYIRRMTPMTLMRKTMSGGLEHVCQSVLRPHFHAGGSAKKYAIRPTIRNSNALSRDDVINTVATAVGPGHTVDLTNYELLILVDVYRNVCGMSVVGNDFEELRKFNLAEIYRSTPKPVSTAVPTLQQTSNAPSGDMTPSHERSKKLSASAGVVYPAKSG